MLYFALIVYSFRLIERAKDRFGGLLVFGMVAIFFWHVVINVAMVTGIMPVVGVPLPMVSYGGSSLASMMFALGCDDQREHAALHVLRPYGEIMMKTEDSDLRSSVIGQSLVYCSAFSMALTSLALGTAPTICSLTAPAFKMIRLGMPRMP